VNVFDLHNAAPTRAKEKKQTIKLIRASSRNTRQRTTHFWRHKSTQKTKNRHETRLLTPYALGDS